MKKKKKNQTPLFNFKTTDGSFKSLKATWSQVKDWNNWKIMEFHNYKFLCLRKS